MNCIEFFARKRVLNDFDLYGNALKPSFQKALTNKDFVELYSL